MLKKRASTLAAMDNTTYTTEDARAWEDLSFEVVSAELGYILNKGKKTNVADRVDILFKVIILVVIILILLLTTPIVSLARIAPLQSALLLVVLMIVIVVLIVLRT